MITESIEDMHLSLMARMAAQKLMHEKPYIGEGIDTDELAQAFLEMLREARDHHRNHYGPG